MEEICIVIDLDEKDVNNIHCDLCEKIKQYYIASRHQRGYPDWVLLPPTVEHEIHEAVQSCRDHKLLEKFSKILQNDYSNVLKPVWEKGSEKYSDRDLKFILTSVFHKLVAMNHQKLDASSQPILINDAQRETIAYIGGSVLRKLYYRAVDDCERKYIKDLSEGQVPASYQARDRGGLWPIRSDVVNLLVQVQQGFNDIFCPLASKKDVPIDLILENTDTKSFLDGDINYSYDVKTKVTKKLVTTYLTSICFGHAKKITETAQIKYGSQKKSLRQSLQDKAKASSSGK